MGKIRIAVLFGGRSAEHEVSIQSAQNVVAALDKSKFDVSLIGIDRNGTWYYNSECEKLLNLPAYKKTDLSQIGDSTLLIHNSGRSSLVRTEDLSPLADIDVVFPVLHGPFGEDGTVQGLLKLAGVPFVGCSVLGSAIGMDKDVMKRLLRDAGISVADFTTLRSRKYDTKAIVSKLGFPVYVKPANMGSSVGVSRASNESELKVAIDEAFNYDRKVIIEKEVRGRELEVSVLGNRDIEVSRVGEIKPKSGFYSYESKYLESESASLEIPANLDSETETRVQSIAQEAYKILECEGMARVDLFLREDGRVCVNEINTIPGFTKISMYPKLWEVTGISYSNLLDRLVSLALERHEEEKALKVSR